MTVVITEGPPYKETVTFTRGVSPSKHGSVTAILLKTTIVGLNVGDLVGETEGN